MNVVDKSNFTYGPVTRCSHPGYGMNILTPNVQYKLKTLTNDKAVLYVLFRYPMDASYKMDVTGCNVRLSSKWLYEILTHCFNNVDGCCRLQALQAINYLNKKVTLPTTNIYVAVACKDLPGPGVWAALIRSGDVDTVITGYSGFTTNHQLGLVAVIKALKELESVSNIMVYTLNPYIERGINYWIERWLKNGWVARRTGRQITNKKLWLVIANLIGKHQVHASLVKGASPGCIEVIKMQKVARDKLQTKLARQGNKDE